jgi:hypothetical protein
MQHLSAIRNGSRFEDLKGHGFSRAVNKNQSSPALAADNCHKPPQRLFIDFEALSKVSSYPLQAEK